MAAIDTNIIVRLLTRDDARQHQAARQLFETEDIFIADTVTLETEWVLRHAYEFSRADICSALRKLFGLPNVRMNNALVVAQALAWHEQGLDFADALHLALSQQQPSLKTFDKSFIKGAKKLSRCLVEQP